MDRNKLWEEIMKEWITYEEAVKNVGYYFTRPEWDGFHFIDGNGQHAIVTKEREMIIVTEEEVLNKESDDWMLVSITNEAVRIVQKHQYSII